MTHTDAFLQEILAHPDDDAPRLIFADWLEEQGDAESVARAEFIRVQCALAAGNLPEQRRAILKKRQRQILKEYGKVWVGLICQWVSSWHFHRGFIDDVSMTGDGFFAHADQLFRLTPIQYLTLGPAGHPEHLPFRGPAMNLAVLADNKHLRPLCGLSLLHSQLESRHVRALVVSEHLTGLTELNLAFNRISDSGMRALAESPLLGQLTRLDLRYNDIGPAGVRALAHAVLRLAHSADGLRLRIVDLQHNNLSAAGQRVIADSPLLRRLVRC